MSSGNTIIKPHDASDVGRSPRGTYVRWSEHGEKDDWSPTMRVVDRGSTILVLRPLRFYERWFYRGIPRLILAWLQPHLHRG